MLGGVTRHIVPHLPGVPHLHVNRLLVLQNSVVGVQNNGKERQKACCTCKFVFLLIRKKKCVHVQSVFLLIRSIDLDAIFIVLPV